MLENILSGFKTFPEFAGIIYRNCCCELEMCVDILRRLRDMVRRKRPPQTKNQQLVSPTRQCSNTPVGFGQGFFFSKEECDKSGESPILPTWLQLIFTCPLD